MLQSKRPQSTTSFMVGNRQFTDKANAYSTLNDRLDEGPPHSRSTFRPMTTVGYASSKVNDSSTVSRPNSGKIMV